MRFPTIILAATAAVLMTGCSSLVSLNPFVDDREAAIDPALIGIWNGGDNDKALLVIRQSGNHYSVLYTEDSSALKFEAKLVRVRDANLLDLVPSDNDGFSVPVHTLLRVWPGPSELRFAFLDSDWLKRQAVQQLASQPSDERTLLTAPAAAVQAVVAKVGDDERAYGKPQTFRRETAR